jgi:hypothetical protein
MSARPISVVDPLATADWDEEDAHWERLQRDGLEALERGDRAAATRHIGQALILARERFESGDPRLAASLASQAWLLRDKAEAMAVALLRESLVHWGQATAWLARQPPPRRLARSSSFHFRLESKHPGAYPARQEERMKGLLALGRIRTETLQGLRSAANAAACEKVDFWASSAPGTFRKVAAAVDFMPRP